MSPTNPFFNHYNRASEQNLIEDLVIESIKMYGFDVLYIPRHLNNVDPIFGEDVTSSFSNYYEVEMYQKNVESMGGEGDFLSKFGIESRDTAVLVVAQSRFHNETGLVRPKEGDLIYLPLTRNLYSISFVQDEGDFYQAGRLYTYELTIALYEYSQETIDTGMEEIDEIVENYAYDFSLTLGAGTGTFVKGEVVFQGATLGAATAKATVISWNSTSKILKLVDNIGEFKVTDSNGLTSDNLVGVTGGAIWTITSVNEMDSENDPLADNEDIETGGGGIIDFTESNPFSEDPEY